MTNVAPTTSDSLMAHHHFTSLPHDAAADLLFSSLLEASCLPSADASAGSAAASSSTAALVCTHRCMAAADAPHRRGDASGRYRDKTGARAHNRSWKLHPDCNQHCPMFPIMPMQCATPTVESTAAALVSESTVAQMTDVDDHATASQSPPVAAASASSFSHRSPAVESSRSLLLGSDAFPSFSSASASAATAAVEHASSPAVSYSVGLNVYTSELLFQHARELLGPDSREYQTASSALHSFFRQLETASAKARLAPPRPSPFIPFKRGGRMTDAMLHSSHSAAAAAVPATPAASSSSSLRCAPPPLLQKPAYLQYALSQLGVGYHHAEFHGFIAYRHDTIRSGEAWGSLGADVVREAGAKLGINLFLDKEDMRVEKWNSQIECVIKGCKLFFLLICHGTLEHCIQPSDPVRVEIETAFSSGCVVVPVLFFVATTTDDRIRPTWLGEKPKGCKTNNHKSAIAMWHRIFANQAFFLSENHFRKEIDHMLERILEYVSGWSPGLHSGVFRELGLTVSSKPEHWYAAFERHVALGRPSNDGVSAYATKHTRDISILTWNLRASQSGHTSGSDHDLLPAQLQVLLQALSRPTILCLQEVCLAMVEQLPEHGYDVLSCDLVYAEVGSADGKLSLAQIADKMKRTKYRPAFSGFNVIAVLRTFRLNRVAGCCLSLAQVLHDYPPQRDSEGAVLERRMLSAVDLTFANQTRPLRIYNTHLHAKPGASGLNERYREMEVICEQLTTQQPQPAGVKAPVTGGLSSSTAAASAASSSSSSSSSFPAIVAATSSSSSPSPPPFFVLCGDLNACSERDYTPGEQYMMYTFSGLDMCQEINYWSALELLETHHAIDSFALAQQPRPKISCWSCRRVDHIVVDTQAAMRWRILHSAVYYTLASDHLPVVCWMREEEQSQAQTQCPGSPAR